MSRDARTTSRVASATPGLSLRTRLTVASLTSACSAMSASLALIAFPPSFVMTDPSLASRPGPDVDHGPIRYEGHAATTKNQITAVCRVRLSHARQVPHG